MLQRVRSYCCRSISFILASLGQRPSLCRAAENGGFSLPENPVRTTTCVYLHRLFLCPEDGSGAGPSQSALHGQPSSEGLSAARWWHRQWRDLFVRRFVLSSRDQLFRTGTHVFLLLRFSGVGESKGSPKVQGAGGKERGRHSGAPPTQRAAQRTTTELANRTWKIDDNS